MTTRVLLVPVTLALLAVAGCSHAPEPQAPDFGNAVRQNIAAHAVRDDPSPRPPDALDATRAGLAMHRYRIDKVEPPKDVHTSDVGAE